MPPLASRDQYESAIVMALAPIFQAQYERALQVGSPSRIDYGQFQSDVQRVLADELFRAFTASGAALVIGHALVISDGVFEDAAKRWAESFARETAASVVNTSRQLTSEAWRTDRASIDDALKAIYLSPSRLDSIAITSVTAAASHGENAVVLLFPENRQRRLVAIWMTREESPGYPAEGVCELCAPFDRTTREVWGIEAPGGPPYHPNCYCHLLWMEAADWARRAA